MSGNPRAEAQQIADALGIPVTFKDTNGSTATVTPKSRAVAPDISGGQVEVVDKTQG